MKTGSLSCRNLKSREFMGTYDLFLKDFHKVLCIEAGLPPCLILQKGTEAHFLKTKSVLFTPYSATHPLLSVPTGLALPELLPFPEFVPVI